MKYGSICSGIEAATSAWHGLGWQPVFFSEIDKFPRAVLAHHYPAVPLHGDFTTLKEYFYGAIDLLVGGTPCQDFSVAGLRAGITGKRGNLTLEFIRLVSREKPRWVVWENVPGVLSSDGGRAFSAFLGGLAECGYGFAYRILDAQYFGVPQRRRRVFVIGYFGDWRAAAAVLFERESLLGDITPRREAGEGLATTISARTKGGGGLGTDFDLDGGCIPIQDKATRHSGGGASRDDDGSANGLGIGAPGDPAPTITSADRHAVAHTLRAEYDGSYTGDGGGIPLVPSISPALKARDHKGASSDGTGDGMPLIPVAFDCKASGRNGFGIGEMAPTLRAMGKKDSHNNGGGQIAVASFKPGQSAAARGIGYEENVAPSLEGGGGGNNHPAIMAGMAVRRLTPRECERLQGFPDDYTLIPYNGKFSADGPRYKALGNSMAVPVMHWIGERIEQVDALMLTTGRPVQR